MTLYLNSGHTLIKTTMLTLCLIGYFLMNSCTFYTYGAITTKPIIKADKEATVGFELKLNCTFEAAENCTYTTAWYVNDTKVTVSRYVTVGTVLQFTVGKADRYHRYACEVGNGSQSLKSDVLMLNPKYPATANMLETYTCNNSQTVSMRCEAEGNPETFTFGDWDHYVGNVLIRRLRGDNTNNLSILKITQCNFQDIGQYYCTVRNGVIYPNYTEVSRAETNFTVNGLAILTGSNIINLTNGYDLMVSYYSYPKSKQQWIYGDDIELNVSPSLSTNYIPMWFGQTVAYLNGTIMVLTVRNTGVYRCIITNDYGSTHVTIDVWSNKVKLEPSQAPLQGSDCSFNSLKFELQIVIIVVAGIFVCILVLSVAMVIIRRCGNSEEKPRKEKRKRSEQGEKRSTRIKSVLEDGTIVYDEIDDLEGKKSRDDHGPCKYEYPSKVQNHGQSYETLKEPNRISKLFHRKKDSKQRKSTLTANASSEAKENTYTESKRTNTAPTKHCTTQPGEIYDEAFSAQSQNKSTGKHKEPTAYITMHPKGSKEIVVEEEEDDSEYVNLKLTPNAKKT